MIELKFGISFFKEELSASLSLISIGLFSSSLTGFSFKYFKFGNWDKIKYAFSWVLKSIFKISKFGIVDNDKPTFW